MTSAAGCFKISGLMMEVVAVGKIPHNWPRPRYYPENQIFGKNKNRKKFGINICLIASTL